MKESISSERVGKLLLQARTDVGKSQEFVAKSLGVSRRTIQNWESGYFSPPLDKCIDFFVALGLQPLPYFLRFLNNEFAELSPKSADKMIESALIERIKMCSPNEQRKLLFLLYGNHGSSCHAIVEMITAHLHVPLKDRLNVAQNVILNYEISEKHKVLVRSEQILPDMDFLKRAFEDAKQSVIERKDAYANLRG